MMTCDRKILLLLCELTEQMLACGLGNSSAKYKLENMVRAYGAGRVDITVLPSDVILTVQDGEDNSITVSRHFTSASGNNFRRLTACSELCRRCCASPLTTEELRRSISEIETIKPVRWAQWVGNCLIVFGATLYFGGQIDDALAALPMGLVMTVLQLSLGKRISYRVLMNLLCSLVVCQIASIQYALFPSLDMKNMLAAAILLLIPGAGVTNGLRDIMRGDSLSGVIHISEMLLWTVSISLGIASALFTFTVTFGA